MPPAITLGSALAARRTNRYWLVSRVWLKCPRTLELSGNAAVYCAGPAKSWRSAIKPEALRDDPKDRHERK